MANFGLSLSSQKYCILQTPSGRNPGYIYLIIDQQKIWKLELNDTVVTFHRSGLPVQPSSYVKGDKQPSIPAANFEFVSEHMRNAIDTNSYSLGESPHSMKLKYTLNGVACEGELSGFSEGSPVDLIKILSKELHRIYGRVSEMRDIAASRGLEINVETAQNEIAMVEKIQQAELRRQNLSTVNPTIRAKKVAKGFGSK